MAYIAIAQNKQDNCREIWPSLRSRKYQHSRYLIYAAAGETARYWQHIHAQWAHAAPHNSPLSSLQTHQTTLSTARTTQHDYHLRRTQW